ncbi:MAG TPA: hypothetical protein VFY82_00300, partial [Acidimicrobiales bacterium]|nr:hypothetical protein [Acidimicrobiales bacterium]
VNFPWTTDTPTDTAITVSEASQPGYVYDPSVTTCTYITPDAPTPAPFPDLGNVPILDVVLTDDQGLAVAFTGGDANGDGAFDPGEVWTFEAIIGPATPGRFDNIGTVTGHDGFEVQVTASDPAFAGTVAPPPAPAPPAPEPPGPAPDPAHAGPSGALPTTGADALRLVLLGLVLVAAGLAVRRGARAGRRRGHRGAGFGPGRHGRHAAPRR